MYYIDTTKQHTTDHKRSPQRGDKTMKTKLINLLTKRNYNKVFCNINEENKEIKVILCCRPKDALETFNQVVIDFGEKYSGYYIESIVAKTIDDINVTLNTIIP
jgi:hypothetical protein